METLIDADRCHRHCCVSAPLKNDDMMNLNDNVEDESLVAQNCSANAIQLC